MALVYIGKTSRSSVDSKVNGTKSGESVFIILQKDSLIFSNIKNNITVSKLTAFIYDKWYYSEICPRYAVELIDLILSKHNYLKREQILDLNYLRENPHDITIVLEDKLGKLLKKQ